MQTQGPLLTFVLQRPDGSQVSPSEVQTLASLNGIHLRAGWSSRSLWRYISTSCSGSRRERSVICMPAGCLCNSGACHHYAQLDSAGFQALIAQGYRCGTSEDIDVAYHTHYGCMHPLKHPCYVGARSGYRRRTCVVWSSQHARGVCPNLLSCSSLAQSPYSRDRMWHGCLPSCTSTLSTLRRW